ncbi:MAG: hypothetical protein NDI77_12215 [Geobacteraceae bacterium]|nr:hypothetical protein [Geobacteraceae bacterium]
MDETKTAKEIGEAWLAFVADTLMISEGRPEVDEELRRLEERGELKQAREESRTTTDSLIEEILDSAPESRRKLFSVTDPRSLALVQDRVKSGTDLLIGMVHKGIEIKTGGAPTLAGFFRQMLLQRPGQ